MSGMNTSEIAGLGLAIIALAGLSVAIVYGGNTARVIKAAGDAFSGSIKAATFQGTSPRLPR